MVEVHEGRISVKPAPRDRAKGGGLSEPSLENRVIVGPGGTTVQRDDTHIKQVHVPPCKHSPRKHDASLDCAAETQRRITETFFQNP
jgi:hypothetical protein